MGFQPPVSFFSSYLSSFFCFFCRAARQAGGYVRYLPLNRKAVSGVKEGILRVRKTFPYSVSLNISLNSPVIIFLAWMASRLQPARCGREKQKIPVSDILNNSNH